MSEIYVGISRTDGSVVHIAFQTEFRNGTEIIHRQGTDGDIETELRRYNREWRRAGDPEMVSWRRLSQEEHDQFGRDRDYRNALEDVGGNLRHNMPKARELHRAVLRHKNGERLLLLDREWVDASSKGNKAFADSVAAKRQVLNDAVNDPRIDAATTLEELKLIVPPAV